MKQATEINEYMFNLLIEKEMDEFSVIEIRDALMKITNEFANADEARKSIYRQILLFGRKGWLVSTGSGRSKRYAKSELFLSTKFSPRSTTKIKNVFAEQLIFESKPELATLAKEKKQYEGELAIILGEVEEFQSLIKRFPQNSSFFAPLFSDAKDRSARVLGRINALSKVLSSSAVQATTSC